MERNKARMLATVLLAAASAGTAVVAYTSVAPASWGDEAGAPILSAHIRAHATGADLAGAVRTFEIVSVIERAGPLPQRRGAPAFGEIVVEAIDADGRVVSTSRLADPQVRRIEMSDATGALSGRWELLAQSDFLVSFEAGRGAVALRFSRVTPDGALVVLGHAMLEGGR